VIAVPGRPETVRGYSANVLATEFAFFENPDETWRALLPSITNPLRGGPKKIRLISTPNGKGNKFHDLWLKNYAGEPPVANALRAGTGGAWSCHQVTITDAVAQGLPIDVEELRAALDDPDGWAQEYDPLDFLDSSAVLLPYELIASCESQEASEAIDPNYWVLSQHGPISTNQFPVDLGIDFGRKRDLTVSWAAEALPGLQVTREVLCLEKMPTPQQVDILRPRIQRARRVALDYTGPGIGMGDYLVKEFGEWNPEKDQFGKIELVTMSNPVKVELFSKLKMAYEAKKWRIPISRKVREDLHSVNRVTTATGMITYRAAHTEDGHADRATAQALCTRAGSYAVDGVTAATIKHIRVGPNTVSAARRTVSFRPRILRT
jgi:phage FluMu gp28-like protein